MKVWKRNAVVAAIVGFVCVAVYLNWSYQKEEAAAGKPLGQATLVGGEAGDLLLTTPAPSQEGEPAGEGAATGYFATARLNRSQARDSAVGLLRDTLGGEDIPEAERAGAQAAIEALAAAGVSEAQIENLVIAKGYADCIAFISDGGVSVVVSSTGEGLTDADVARVAEVVTSETGVPASQVRIIEAQG